MIHPEFRRIAWVTLAVMAALALSFAGWVSATIINPPPAEQWGIYTTPAILGQRTGTDVERDLNREGYPIADSPASLPMHAVRCGPPVTVYVTSTRSWEILGATGDHIAVEAPSELELPIAPGQGSDLVAGPWPPCYPISFTSVTAPATVADAADGRPIAFTLTIRADDWAPVTLTSEWFVIGDRADSTDTYTLAVPDVSPIRRAPPSTDPEEQPP